ncbi:WASH complex subunit 5 [Onthophagus taurus]|uniref:WASH complex subunit 5 n=1 Tax=Onthophagus taurus TaxID=166361 RepID=UPI0039BE5ED9
MVDFLAENNVCGQNILQLVSRGNAIIAEILRLKDYIPNLFRLQSKQDAQKYGEIILDFGYFKIAEAQEYKIENNDALQDLDGEFRDNHIQIIQRFYLVFKSIHTYVTDLIHYIDELNDGMYLHQSLESVFSDVEGRQLMCEALYLYGTMLLIVDAHIEGIIRERLLVAYYRYTPQQSDTQSCIDEVCKLLRDTGLTTKKPNNYPEDYFRRITLPSSYVDIVIGRLRSDDIYNQLTVYQRTKHRSTALSSQAAMLYICLFFSTNILHNQTAIMREIVDKYFPDNWVVSIYMGFTCNLIESWESFKAARTALNNTLEVSNVKFLSDLHNRKIQELYALTSKYLQEGIITRDNLLSIINNIINLLKDCNVVVRWLVLHTSSVDEKNKKSKQIRDMVITESKCENNHIFKLLLHTAQLELITRDIFKNLLSEKEQNWEDLKKESYNSLIELSEVFGGTKPLTRVEKNPSLNKWFLEIAKQVESLIQSDNASARKLIQLIQALEEVQEYHQLDAHMQIVQFLSETRKYLNQMIGNMNIKEDILITMQIIGDISYAWELIDSYTPIMQSGIKRDPNLVIQLRAVFLKLASALEIPLLRINQAHSEDFVSVSQYFSGELEIYMRKVLQIIPRMMFEKLAKIIEMQTNVLKELPTKLDKDKIREYAQLKERFEYAKLTHSISLFSMGMRMMKSTLVGVICLDPKNLLDDGIRKELVQHISKALHKELVFSPKGKHEDFLSKLKTLAAIMDGYKRSFEYIQDYVSINGLKTWQEEVTRIINYNVEQECNGFLRNKVHAWESVYQSRIIPIPSYSPIDTVSENFIGRLAREIIRLTDTKTTSYIEQTATWYDVKTRKIIVNKQTINLIMSAIEVTGLVGLDRLFSFMITTNLQKVITILENKDNKNVTWTNVMSAINGELKTIETNANISKYYQNCINRTTKLFVNFLELVLNIGQLQLLRNLINFHLNTTCKFNSKNLEASLSALNKALLSDILNHSEPTPPEDTLFKLSQYFDYTGMNNPCNKIYVTVKTKEAYASILFMFVVAHLQKLYFFVSGGNIKRTIDQYDGPPLIFGLHTVIKQFNTNLNDLFIQYLCKYVIQLSKQSSLKSMDVNQDAFLALKFLDSYATLSKTSKEYLRNHVPDELFYLYQSICTVNA